ncbi:MAG: hypothetical protein ACMUIE_10075, partial [Thermoplasmatota archaeon]
MGKMKVLILVLLITILLSVPGYLKFGDVEGETIPSAAPSDDNTDPVGPIFGRPYNGATHYVGGTGSFTNIQDAVDAASDGDKVVVNPGTYSEAVDVQVEIWISGLTGARLTNPGGINIGLELSANNVTVSGMNITDFYIGILAPGTSGHNISGCSFWGNGIHFSYNLVDSSRTDDIMDHGIVIRNNFFGHSSGYHLSFMQKIVFSGPSMYNVTRGDIIIEGNTMVDSGSATIFVFELSYSSIKGGGTFNIGDIRLIDN